MFLPAKYKPNITLNYSDYIIEVPNAISLEIVEEIKNYALNREISGLHKQKAKSSIETFSTCKIHDLDHPIYKTLDSLWKQHASKLYSNICFIEQYEIKMYEVGDKFNSHVDNFGYNSTKLDRQVTLLIQLSDSSDYVGGNLIIGNYQVSRKVGTAIFFPSSFTHRVEQIYKGKRYSLINWAWGPI